MNVSYKSKGGNWGMPSKFDTSTGMDTRPPSTLPAVDSVVTPPLSVAVTVSVGNTCENCRIVPAWVEVVVRNNVVHASATERRKNRAKNANP